MKGKYNRKEKCNRNGKDIRKNSWKVFGTIALGLILLAGCGNDPEAVTLDGQPPEAYGTGTESQSGQEQGSQEQYGQQITLTLGVVGGGSQGLEAAVEAYNAQSGKYYVEIVDYLSGGGDNAAYAAAYDRFRMELATGKGTDIVCLGDLSADELGYAGVLKDLNVFLTPEDKQEKYLGNILECAQTGGGLYEISPAFILEFIVGDGSRIGMENGWTLEEMLESFEKCGRDGTALGKGGVRTVARLVEFSMEDYVDWDAGTADFCKEEFYRVLEFGRETDNGEFVRPTRESAASGTHLASCEMLVGPADVQQFKWLFGDNMAVKGYPCSQGTGVAVRLDGSMGICSYSQCPEGAWDFLEFYAGAAWTKREVYAEGILIKEDFSDMLAGFPVNRQLFEEILEQSMVQEYYQEGLDAGKPVPLLQGEGEQPDFYANTAEDVEKLREIIGLADRRSLSGLSAISRIVEEEISGYNAGVLTVEQTADKIQNRVQLYLDEQR